MEKFSNQKWKVDRFLDVIYERNPGSTFGKI